MSSYIIYPISPHPSLHSYPHIHTPNSSSYPSFHRLCTPRYEGSWFNKAISYAVYPIGIDIDPNDPLHVTVAIGHQDRDIFITRFLIRELVQTLTPVHSCSSQT